MWTDDNRTQDRKIVSLQAEHLDAPDPPSNARDIGRRRIVNN